MIPIFLILCFIVDIVAGIPAATFFVSEIFTLLFSMGVKAEGGERSVMVHISDLHGQRPSLNNGPTTMAFDDLVKPTNEIPDSLANRAERSEIAPMLTMTSIPLLTALATRS